MDRISFGRRLLVGTLLAALLSGCGCSAAKTNTAEATAIPNVFASAPALEKTDATPEPRLEATGEAISEAPETAATPSEKPITVQNTEKKEETITMQEDQLTAIFEKVERKFSDVTGSQLVTVESNGSDASVTGWEKGEDGIWRVKIEACKGCVGKNGTAPVGVKKEGDYCTPLGLYPLPLAFGILDDPGTKLPYTQVDDNDYWVDDPKSKYYNCFVDGSEEKDWNSGEHLLAVGESYNYAVFIAYNVDPIVPGAGCAIFFHCRPRPTAGCVAIEEKILLRYMRWLDPDCSPEMLIV